MAVTDYIWEGFDEKAKKLIIRHAVNCLRHHQFDAIAVRGVSGMLIGPIVAYLLRKQLIIVRKPKEEESTHAYQHVECNLTQGTYVVLDDFVSSGATVKAIVEQMKLHCPLIKPIGAYYWRSGDTASYEKKTGLKVLGFRKSRSKE